MSFHTRALLALSLVAASPACQVGGAPSSTPGLIEVVSCDRCAGAYEECIAGGNEDGICEETMCECYAECDVGGDGEDCRCEKVFDECMKHPAFDAARPEKQPDSE